IFDVKVDAELNQSLTGENTAYLIFATPIYLTPDLPVDWGNGKVAYQESTEFEPYDYEYMDSYFNLIMESIIDYGILTTASVDFTIGCDPFVVSGYKYEDLNGNGQRDAGEPGIEGWEISMQSGFGTITALTDATGFYSFSVLQPSTYQVRETDVEGWHQSAPAG